MAALVMLSASVLLGLLLPCSMAYNALYSGETLYTGQSLSQGAYTFIMQSDCNLVLYDNGKALWSSGTYNQGRNCILRMQTDGNLVIYSKGRAVWASQTSGAQGYFVLVMQSDRNVVIYSNPTWATNTHTDNSKGVVIVNKGRNSTSLTP